MNIWFISIFEQTPLDKVFSTRFISIANEAVERGHKVTFFASTFKHNTKNQRFLETTTFDVNENYKMIFIKSMSYESNISFKRLKSHYFFAKDAIFEFNKHEKPDAILMAFPPITLAEKVSSWAKENKIPIAMDIIDPWPDTFEITFPSAIRWMIKPVFLPMRKRLERTLPNLSALTSISQQYIDWASSFYNEIPTKKVFYPAADYELMNKSVGKYKKYKNNDKLTLIYAGSLALSYDLDCILGTAKLLNEAYPDIKFLIAGAGSQEVKVKEYEKNHSNLKFLGRLDKEELMKAYAESDLGFTQHIKGATQSVTYKLFDLLSSGLPILNSLESEMKTIILDNQVGLHNEPGNSIQLKENILQFYNNRSLLEQYRDNGYRLTLQKGDSKVLYSAFVDLLESIVISK